jgi:hypothetical protein
LVSLSPAERASSRQRRRFLPCFCQEATAFSAITPVALRCTFPCPMLLLLLAYYRSPGSACAAASCRLLTRSLAHRFSSACPFGWWLMAGAGLFWDKSTVGWLLMTDLLWKKSTDGW